MKKLYILRHAKSDYPDNISDDHERPLSKRGEKSCKTMGHYLRANAVKPEVILSSDSVRTTQTINSILNEAEYNINVEFLSKLYLATPGEILKEIAKVDDNISSVMVVCHNPGAEQLSTLLMESGHPESIYRMKEKFPTAAMASFSIHTDSWKQINPKSGYLDSFITPKFLE